jgi:hypothetical protein
MLIKSSSSVYPVAYIQFFFCLLVLLSSCTGALAESEGFKLQAPFDSFVCYNSSFKQCLNRAQAGQLKTLSQASYKQKDGAPAMFGVVAPDSDAGKVPPTKDGTKRCYYGTVPYTLTLKEDAISPAVFVSPVLLRQIGEMQIRISRARTACARLIQAYDHQAEISAVQEGLAKAQVAIGWLSSELESDRLRKEGYGGRLVNAEERDKYHVPPSHLFEALQYSRTTNSIPRQEELRGLLKKQLDMDYENQFFDANLGIDLQLRELARMLFILDRSAAPDSMSALKNTGYGDGAWVKQGTVVLSKGKFVEE